MVTHRQFSTVGRLCLGMLSGIRTKPQHMILMGEREWDKLVSEMHYWATNRERLILVSPGGFQIKGVPVVPTDAEGVELVIIIKKGGMNNAG